MPTFPTYHGELPECLNPLNPRHYLLLLYWVFFRPTALKCHLYQADPQFYQSKFETSFLRILTVTTYRNVINLTLVLSIFLSISTALPITFLLSKILHLPIDPLKLLISLISGTVLSLIFTGIIGMLFGLIGSVATSIEVGVVAFINGCIALSISISVTASLVTDSLTKYPLTSSRVILGTAGLAVGIVFGGMVGIVVGTAFRTLFKIGRCMIAGLGAGVVIGLISAATTNAIVLMGGNIMVSTENGVLIALTVVGVCCITAGTLIEIISGVMGSIAVGGATGVIIGAFIGIVFVMVSTIEFKWNIMVFVLFFATPVGIGSLRLMLYPFQFLLSLLSNRFRLKNPVEWDELLIVSLPYTRRLLKNNLQQTERQGLQLLIELAHNPFRRPQIQKILHFYLHNHLNPLGFLYQLFTNTNFDKYVVAPVRKQDWGSNISFRRLFLGNLALRFVKTTSVSSIIFYDRLIWWLTYPLRDRKGTPLTRFAEMLYDLFDETAVETEQFELSAYSEAYTNLSPYPGDQEIAQTFDTMTLYLSYTNLSNLANAFDTSSNLSFDDPIRPAVLTALKRLGEIGAEIKTYQDSSSRANQMAALARATDALKDLDEYVQEEVVAPEQYILRRIIRQWQALLITAGGELGRAEEVGPIVNPYVAGNPVTGELFVGRADILRRLEELWSGDGQKPSIVLYGHRRMGKSSILHNLGTRFGKNTEIVDFNMQRAGLVFSTGELLFNLALAMYDALEAGFQSQADSEIFGLSEPEEEAFMAHNPYTVFDRFLKQVDRIRGEKRFIISIDEFEMIEQKIHKGNLEALLLDFCRGLIQTYPWFIVAFAGLHTLQEMTHDYWNPLFGSVTGVPVSFLKERAVKQLITQPTSDFSLDYDQDAITEIVHLTNGQSYLVQLICHNLVSLFNRQTFEEGIERERRFSLVDVEAVIDAPEFFRDGEAYFSGVWQQAQGSEPAAQHDILKILAQTESGLPINALVEQSGLASEAVQQALKFLQRHDVIKKCDETWSFSVELMRRWVKQREQFFSHE